MKWQKSDQTKVLVFLVSLGVGIGIEYLWLGKEAFEAFGIIMLPIFVAPIFILLISIEQRYNKKTPKKS